HRERDGGLDPNWCGDASRISGPAKPADAAIGFGHALHPHGETFIDARGTDGPMTGIEEGAALAAAAGAAEGAGEAGAAGAGAAGAGAAGAGAAGAGGAASMLPYLAGASGALGALGQYGRMPGGSPVGGARGVGGTGYSPTALRLSDLVSVPSSDGGDEE